MLRAVFASTRSYKRFGGLNLKVFLWALVMGPLDSDGVCQFVYGISWALEDWVHVGGPWYGL